MADTFSAQQVAAALSALAASAAPLQMYAQTLLQQPIVSMDEVPSLATDLQEAHAVSRYCVDSVLPQALRVDAAAIGFSNQLLAMYPEFLVLARQMDGGGPASQGATARFIEGLELLCKNLTQQGPAIADLAAQASALSTRASEVSTKLTADAQAAAGSQEIADLQQQINDTLAAIDADCQVISKGMSGTNKALVKLAIQEFNIEDDAKAGVKAFVGFILDVANENSAVIEAQNDIQRQLKTLASLYAQLSPLLVEAAVAQNAASEAALFSTNATRTQQAALTLGQAWLALEQGFQALATTLQSGAATEPLAPQLADCQAAWEALLAGCKSWQTVGLFPVTVLPPPDAAAA